MKIRTYSDLIKLPTFIERIDYLRTYQKIGVQTFGQLRYLNQMLYQSYEWKRIHDAVIIRDTKDGYPLDLAHPECVIYGHVTVHHMVPITVEMIRSRSPYVFDPEFLISCSDETHRAIHYRKPVADYIPRRPNDTCPWKN